MFRFLVILSILFTNLGLVQAKTPPSQRTAPKINMLAVLHAKEGQITKDQDQYKLELINVAKGITLFSDRPNRKAFSIPMEKFLEYWDEGSSSFQKTPPNASLAILLKEKGQFKDLIIELTEPVFSSKTNTLTFNVKPVEKTAQVEEGKLGEVTLFIDSMSCPPSACQVPGS